MEFNPKEELLNTLEESKDAEYVELYKKAVEAQMELRKVMDKRLEKIKNLKSLEILKLRI
ncbi:hypothetical protein KVL59_04770 [Helicobacter pylori]|nr:hypothetical protein KVL59_04770 [Helicobacter pylori]